MCECVLFYKNVTRAKIIGASSKKKEKEKNKKRAEEKEKKK